MAKASPNAAGERGVIVNTASVAAFDGQIGQAAYSASKSVVHRLTESLSAELREHGINVNCVMPSIIDGPANRADMPNADFSRWVSPADLAEVTAELASVFRSAVERAGLDFQVDCPPLAEPVYLDRGMWEKVLLNLLSNAVKFTRDGGSVNVTARRMDGDACVSVTDTGIGIAEADQERIFAASWNYVGRVEQVAKPGDFLTGRVGEVPVVIVRDEVGTLRAYANVCGHRGSELVLEKGGNRRTLQCHYHAWTWGLDGTLRAAPHCQEQAGFNKADFPLTPLGVETFGPFLFVNPGPASCSFAAALGQLPAILRSAGADIDAVRSAHQNLLTEFQQFSQRMYEHASAQQSQQAPGGAGTGGSTSGSDDEVADAEIVDDDQQSA